MPHMPINFLVFSVAVEHFPAKTATFICQFLADGTFLLAWECHTVWFHFFIDNLIIKIRLNEKVRNIFPLPKLSGTGSTFFWWIKKMEKDWKLWENLTTYTGIMEPALPCVISLVFPPARTPLYLQPRCYKWLAVFIL